MASCLHELELGPVISQKMENNYISWHHFGMGPVAWSSWRYRVKMLWLEWIFLMHQIVFIPILLGSVFKIIKPRIFCLLLQWHIPWQIKISFFLCSEELMVSLRETLKSVKDIQRILRVKKNFCFFSCYPYLGFQSLFPYKMKISNWFLVTISTQNDLLFETVIIYKIILWTCKLLTQTCLVLSFCLISKTHNSLFALLIYWHYYKHSELLIPIYFFLIFWNL